GSVWPQDNGIIAAGFKRYGLVKEANQVIRALFDAIERFDAYRPPEVFAGLKRRGDMDFPVLYPGGANIPQAWATGSIFHMVRTILGLRADAPHNPRVSRSFDEAGMCLPGELFLGSLENSFPQE